MAHMVETMAYAGQVPWHGLGVPVEDCLNPGEMLGAANLNWTVEKQDLVTSTGIEIPGKKALVRTSDNTLLDVIGTDWNPVQNIEAFEFFNDFVSNGDMKMHTAGSLDDGKMVWALAKVNDGFELFNGDTVESYLLFSNPHQYGKAIDVRFTPIRVVCNNTLTLSLETSAKNSVKVNHKNVFNGEMVKEMLGVAHAKLENYKEMAEFLGSKRYTKESITDYFDNVFPISYRGKGEAKKELSNNANRALQILNTQPGATYAEGSFWQAFNAVTYLTDHEMGRDVNSRIKQSWFGYNQRLKAKALQTAVEYAEAA